MLKTSKTYIHTLVVALASVVAPSTLWSQSINVTLSPSTATVSVGQTFQFTGKATPASRSGITWNVNGIVGGNTTTGTISSSGLYTAPAILPSPSSVTVSAVSTTDPSKSANALVTVVSAGPPTVSVTVSPGSATVQVSQTQQFAATVSGSSNTSVIWTVNGVAGGNSIDGTISTSGLYTAPAAVPSSTVTVAATSAADWSKSGQAAVDVVSGVLTLSPSATTVSTSQSVQFNVVQAASLQNGGGSKKPATYTWKVNGINGGNSVVGTISNKGVYTAPGLPPTPATTTITATSSSNQSGQASATITIPVSVTLSPASASVMVSQTQQFTASVSGTSNTAVTWSVNGVPGGNSTVGTVSSSGFYGAPTAVPSPAAVTVTATSAADTTKSAGAIATITAPTPTITTSSLPNGKTGLAYSATLAATGGTTPYTWSILSGQLPTGVGLGTISGTISGTPSTAGTYNITVQLTDATGQVASTTLAFVIAAALSVTSTTVPNGTVGVPYSATLTTSGGKPPVTWAVASGQLPTGLSLSSSGSITGTPSSAWSYTFVAQATDSAANTASQSFTLNVSGSASGGGTITITNADLPNGTVGTAYTAGLSATGGTPPYSWSLASGALSAGLTLDSSTGVISGTPFVVGWSNMFAIQVQDSAGATTSLQYSTIINPVLDLYGGVVGQSCAATGWFHTQKIGNRWWLCTPSGNVSWMTSLGGAFAPDNGCDANTGTCNDYQTIAKNKYGDLDIHWGPQQNRRLQSWGFNSVGQLSSGWMQPTQTCIGCDGWPGSTQPVKLPVTQTILVSNYAAINLWNYASHPVKNMMFGINSHYTGWRASVMDFFDPAFAQFVDNMIVNDAGVKSFLASPWTIGLFLDDTDWFWGMGAGPDFHTIPAGHTNAHAGYMTLITASSQTYNPDPANRGVAQLYTDGKTYSKVAIGASAVPCAVTSPCSLRDYLYKKYSGSISALNQSWGSNYTTFDSTGSQVKGELIGIGNGIQTSFSHTLASTPVTPESVLISVGGTPQGGDCPWWNAACSISSPGVGSLAGPAGSSVVTGSEPWLSAFGWQDCNNCGLPPASYWVRITYHMKPGFYSGASREVGDTKMIPNQQIVVTPPPPDPNATGWDVYVSCENKSTPGTSWCGPQGTWNNNKETLQASNISFAQPWIEPASGLISGAPVAEPPSIINYNNGTIAVTFSRPPAVGQQITADYVVNGWMYGTGLMDEDGRHTAWLGTNAYCLTPAVACDGVDLPVPNAQANVGADLDAWITQFAGQYFSSIGNSLKKHAPSIMYLGADTVGTWGTPARKEILAGASPYVDILFTQWFAGMPDDATSDNVNQYLTRYFGDKPLMNFMTLQANPDSALSQYSGDAVTGNPTQEQRAQLYSRMMTAMLTKLGTNGTYQWVGMNWWGLTDYWNEKYNWGLVSLQDNPYDGKSATTAARTDSWGFGTGKETQNYGNGIDLIKSGNSRWLEILLGGTLP